MNQHYVIRKMKKEEVQIAIDWAQNEGWNPGLHDAQCFYQADPSGFFIGLLNNEPIATGCAIAYDDHFAFCGLYIVKKEFRHHEYGIQLTQERLRYLGNRITGLDGVIDMTDRYERLGYVAAHKNIRYAYPNQNSFSPSPNIVPLETLPFSQIATFDSRYFPADRTHFLQGWITQPSSVALGYVQDQSLSGYGVIRKCVKGYKIGPLFAHSPQIAQHLFEALCSHCPGEEVFLDIPEPNSKAAPFIRDYKMTSQFEVLRMYRNGTPQIDLQGIYGITTYEIG